MTSRLRPLILCTLFATVGAMVRAQAPPDGTVTTISEVLSLDGRDADANPRPVRLKGVVLGESTMFPFVSLHDGSRSVGVRLKRDHPVLKQGDTVEVLGKTTMTSVNGWMHPRVVAESIQVTGTGELPPATSISVTQLASVANYDQWVSLDAFVMEWKFQAPDLQLRLVSREGYADANVTVPDATSLPAKLQGARLRLTGAVVSTPALGKVLFVPDLQQLEVTEPGLEGIFDAPLVTISDVMQRKLDHGRRWRVKGVVAARAQERNIIITSPDGGMSCYLLPDRGPEQSGTIYGDGGPWPAIIPGDEVELVGSIVDSGDSDTRSCGLVWCQVRVSGKSSPPKPKAVDLETLVGWRNHDDWVSVEGVVIGWMLQNSVMCYAVLGPQSYSQVYVREIGATPFPADLHGARVRFTGVSRSLLQNKGDVLMVPNPSFVEIVKPGSSDPFAVSAAKASDISAGRLPPAERFKMRGVLIGRTSETILYVRGPDGAICVNLQIRWNRPANASGMFFADCGEPPALHIGDEVEVMGSPQRAPDGTRPNGFDLQSCHVRVVGKAGEVNPVRTTLREVEGGAHSSDLVEVRGRLLTLQQVPMDRGEWRTTMLIEADGVTMPAAHHDKGRAAFDTLKVDDEVVLRGLVDHATSRDPRQLRLISAGDVKSLGLSPVVRRRQFWLWGGGGGALLALLLGWIAILRRSSRLQTEAAAMLEQRVDERTAELCQTQANLNRALAQERELGELKTRFVSMVSHEFRTPLGVIMSAVELLQHYSDRLPDDEKKHQLHAIQSSTKHMGNLMEQVLVLGRAEAGKLSCHPQPLDLAVFAEKVIDEAQSITSHKCSIVTQIDGDVSGARADESLLRHILSNLITNAVKYSDEKSEVTLRVSRDGDDAVFAIIDHGIGIPEKDRERLFEAFHRGSNVGETPGTGLGLVIVRRCVDLHGGSIQLASEVGSGTTFTIHLPLFGKTL